MIGLNRASIELREYGDFSISITDLSKAKPMQVRFNEMSLKYDMQKKKLRDDSTKS